MVDDAEHDAPASPVDAPEDEARSHERRRIRSALRVLAVFGGLAVLAAGGAGVAGGDGRLGLLTLLWVGALGTAAAGLQLGLLLVVDEVRGRPTSLRRGGVVLALFAATATLMSMVIAVGTGAA